MSNYLRILFIFVYFCFFISNFAFAEVGDAEVDSKFQLNSIEIFDDGTYNGGINGIKINNQSGYDLNLIIGNDVNATIKNGNTFFIDCKSDENNSFRTAQLFVIDRSITRNDSAVINFMCGKVFSVFQK